MSESPTEAAGTAIWQDRVLQVSMGLAIALNLLLFILVLVTGQQLDEAIAKAGVESGSVDRFGAPSNALILPIIGLVSWIAGGAISTYFYNVRDEAPIAYIIWGTVVLIELATWVPVLTLIIDL